MAFLILVGALGCACASIGVLFGYGRRAGFIGGSLGLLFLILLAIFLECAFVG
jgi:hypothetical protein